MDESQTRRILQALEGAAVQDPDLRAYYELHRALFQILAEVRAEITAALELVDEEALQGRLLQGRSLLSFAQLPLEEERFAELVSTVAGVLAEYTPELAEQTVAGSPADLVALARERFESGQVESDGSERVGEASLAQTSVDLGLKPYLEWAAEQAMPHIDQEKWKRRYCPVCAGVPDLAFLEEEAGARHLLCSRCGSQWLFRRLGCPFCGTNEYAKLSYHLSQDEVYRLYVCQACHRYLKTIDLRKIAREVLFPVERVTTLAMDVAAQEAGYR